jgi:FkbM family methyltransferase
MAEEFIKSIEPFFRYKAVSLVDIGAHKGETFGLFAESGLKIHEAHLFEPNPKSFALLRDKFEGHPKAHKFHLHKLALGRQPGRAVLQGLDDMSRVADSSASRPMPSSIPFDAEIVEVTTLDKAAATFALPRISILKIDVEGSEVDVLEGAQALLNEGKIDIIYVEAGMNEKCNTLTYYRRLEDFLLPLGFQVFKFFEQHHEWPDDSPLLRRTNIAFMRKQFAQAHPYRLTNALDRSEKKIEKYRKELEARRKDLETRERANEELRAALLEQKTKLRELKQTLTYRLGKAMVEESRSIAGILLLPYRLLSVYCNFRHERRDASHQQSPSLSLGPRPQIGRWQALLDRLGISPAWRIVTGNPLRLLSRAEISNAADTALRNKDHISALVLYAHLAEFFPRIHSYKNHRDEVSRAVSCEYGQTPVIDTRKTTARGKQLRLLHTLISLGFDKSTLLDVVKRLPHKRDRYALVANLHAGEDAAAWQHSVNSLLANYGLRGLELKPPAFSPTVMHNLAFQDAPTAPRDRGLVSICISAHNSAETLGYAIESILHQDYQNFELFVLDDASTDGTDEVARSFAAKDSRIKVVLNDRNRGTYWNRNLALSRAKGVYFTTLDADDFCHPERIPLQLAFLDENPRALGVFGLWFRVDHSGRLTYRNFWGGVIVHEAVATLLFKREVVTSRIGYYDSVKISADTEYLERIRKVFGGESVRLLHKPLAIALAHAQSLTSAHGFGIHNYFGLSKPRRDYRSAWMRWHQETNLEQLYIPFPANGYQRPFDAPQEILIPLNK